MDAAWGLRCSRGVLFAICHIRKGSGQDPASWTPSYAKETFPLVSAVEILGQVQAVQVQTSCGGS